jgi:hypothetical protein
MCVGVKVVADAAGAGRGCTSSVLKDYNNRLQYLNSHVPVSDLEALKRIVARISFVSFVMSVRMQHLQNICT